MATMVSGELTALVYETLHIGTLKPCVTCIPYRPPKPSR